MNLQIIATIATVLGAGFAAGMSNAGPDSFSMLQETVRTRNDMVQPAVPESLFMFVASRTQACFKVLEDPEMRPLFAPDFIWHVNGFVNEKEWARMMQLLRQLNPNIVIGYYHSACTTMPSNKDLTQPCRMPNEQVPDDWILKYANGKPVTYDSITADRFLLDMRISAVRQAMISLAIARAKHYGYDALSFDNCYWGCGVPAKNGSVVSAEQWTMAFMSFYEEAGKAARENGLKCVVNVAMRGLPEGVEAIAPYVDGIMTELPFQKTALTNSFERELEAYENVLKQGKLVLLLQTVKGRGFETLTLARPLVDKYNTIYVCIQEWWPYYFRRGYEDSALNQLDKSDVPPVSAWYRHPQQTVN